VKTPALGRRVAAVTLAVLAVAFAGFAVATTVSYRDGLMSDLRTHLTNGARALDTAPARSVRSLVGTLHLEGIQVDIRRAPTSSKRGAPAATLDKGPYLRSQGSLLVLHQRLANRSEATLSASVANVSASVDRLIVIELIAAVVTLAVSALVLARGLRAALAPLGHVGRVAARIAAGDRRQRLRPSRPDTELGRMAASFDAMVGALDDAVQQAQSSEHAMRRFVADASHELRSPITALQAGVETLLRVQPERPARDGIEAQLAREAARLGRLADDLLSLARLEASEPARRDPVDVAEGAANAAAQARERAHSATIALHASGDTSVLGDEDALTRALRNLIDNALAATGMTGSITIEVDRVGATVAMRVSDDGPGIPAAERERIFDGFVRLNRTAAAGAGLGLGIARRIARQHGGDLTCDEGGTGASFTLTIPAARSRSRRELRAAAAS
jgi:signal transduction histidine kinase